MARSRTTDDTLGLGRSTAIKVVRFYAILGALWILVTDGLVFLVEGHNRTAAELNIVKGLFYVLLTSIALYIYITKRIVRGKSEQKIIRQRLTQLSKYANDIVLLFDESGIIIEANDRAVEAYGFALSELVGKHVDLLRAPGTDWRADWDEIRRTGGMRHERAHLRADGSQFPVEISWRRIDNEGGWLVQSIVRDISARRKAEQQITHLKDVYAALSQTNQCIVRVSDRHELFKSVCDIAIRFGHFRLAWIGIVDDATTDLIIEGAAGPDIVYLDGLHVSANPNSPLSIGPTGQAVITDSPFIANNLPELLNTSPWRNRMGVHGLKSSAAFPLHCKDKCIGALTVYSNELGFFSQDLIDLLTETADDISFALSRIASDEEKQQLELEVATSNARLAGIIEGSRNAVAAVDSSMRVTQWNREHASLMQHAFGIVMQTGMDFGTYLTDSNSQVRMIANAMQRATQGEAIQKEWSAFIGGKEFFFESYFAPLLDASGRSIGAFHIDRDVTEHRRMQENLRKLNIAVEQSPITVVITNLDGIIEYVNPAFTASSGYTAEEVLGKNPRVLKSGEMSTEEYRALWNTISSGNPWTGIFHNRRKDGSLYWEEAAIAPVRDSDGIIRQYIAIKHDITARLEAEERATFLAFHDPLTHLPNRGLVKSTIGRALVSAQAHQSKAALLSIDVDNFKKVNESLGFLIGDKLLQALALRLSSALSPNDALCRLGGDEFLVVLSDLKDTPEIEQRADAIMRAVDEPFEIDSFELTLKLSIGVAVYPDDGADSDALQQNADLALYFAKKSGRNCYRLFSSQMEGDAHEYVTLLNGLRRALEHQEFRLVYQPQVKLSDGSIVGAEALLRWDHPTLGPIRPDRFISIAENSGLIFEIGKWVVEEACRQAADWKQRGISGMRVAVNLSAVQLRRAGLPEIVQHALSAAGLEPTELSLELTESALVENKGNASAILKQLREMGVHLSLDDFGTEYSSFAYLRSFQLNELKIDQSFIRGIRTNPGDESIVRSIVEVAKGFNLTTVAEGVEDEATLEVVRRAGCDIVQGYYFAKPMGPEALLEYVFSPDRKKLTTPA
ncbi:MAG: EAL domain-containing protein [Terracidiphilus sp.]|nr:EAL domain-containing protein [Terracidiphilus sp.]